MKRRDHLWSLIVSFTVCDIIAQTLASGESVQSIDIYHDPKSLRLDHAEAWRDSITRRMAQRGTEVIERKGLSHIVPFSIRNLTEVDKAKSKNSPDIFQRGVWIADQVARHKKHFTLGQFSRITNQDFSAYITRYFTALKELVLTPQSKQPVENGKHLNRADETSSAEP